MPGPRRILEACAFPFALLAVNYYFAQDLFRLEYSVWMGSIEAAYISISRYAIENWSDLTWFPLWYGGIPFQNTYPPLLHLLVALAAALFRASPAHAHHAVTAAFYILGPVSLYALALRLSRSAWYSFWAALAYSILSPSLFLMPSVRAGMAGYFELRRFVALVPYGEGPHIASLALLPLAILALDYALERGRPLAYILAALAMAAVALANWLGAFALALAVFAYLLARGFVLRDWLRAAAIAALSYALACSWIPPSTIAAVRYNAQFVGDYAGVYRRLPFYAAAALAALWLLQRLFARRQISVPLRFFLLFALLVSAIPLTEEYFHVAVVPQPNRYHLEMEMALCLAAAFAVKPLAGRLPPRGKSALAAALMLLCVLPVRLDRRHARRMVKPIDITGSIEYQSAKWFDAHTRNYRVFVPGTISYWLNAFTDTPQLGGGFDQGIVNRALRPVQYQIYSGAGAATAAEGRDVALLWLRAFGVGFIETGGPASREGYQPFRKTARFDILAPLFRDGDDAIRAVPQTSQLAHVIPPGAAARKTPENGLDLEPVKAYAAALGPRTARFRWTSRHSAKVFATMHAGDLLSVQVSYHPGWHAAVDGQPRPLVQDGLGQILVHPRCPATCVVDLNYDGGAEMRAARLISWSSLAGCMAWIFAAGIAAPVNALRRRRRLLPS